MDSQLVITLKDFLLFILWGGIVTLFIYLILILRRVLKVMKAFNEVVDGNRENIDATMNIVPDLTKHVEMITGEVAHDVQAFRSTIDNIAGTTESITDTIKENQGFMNGLSSLMHTVAIGKTFYDKYFASKIKDIKDTVNEANDIFNDNQDENNN